LPVLLPYNKKVIKSVQKLCTRLTKTTQRMSEGLYLLLVSFCQHKKVQLHPVKSRGVKTTF